MPDHVLRICSNGSFVDLRRNRGEAGYLHCGRRAGVCQHCKSQGKGAAFFSRWFYAARKSQGLSKETHGCNFVSTNRNGLAALLVITDQLSALTMKQDMLERQQRSSSSGVRPKHLSSLAAELGPPPKTKGTKYAYSSFAARAASAMQELGSPCNGSLAPGTRPMQAGSTDPMSDISSTTPSMRVKALWPGAVFLKVCQSMQRRVNPGPRSFNSFRSWRCVTVGLSGEVRSILSKSGLGMVQWSQGHVRCHGQGRVEPCAGSSGAHRSHGGAGCAGLKSWFVLIASLAKTPKLERTDRKLISLEQRRGTLIARSYAQCMYKYNSIYIHIPNIYIYIGIYIDMYICTYVCVCIFL